MLSILGGGVDSTSCRIEWKRYNKFNREKVDIKTSRLKSTDEEIVYIIIIFIIIIVLFKYN